ncbi:MAG TPA: exosortase/archaeosortase family protein, partial [Tepidisphaeraceae bacterium]|nr:exosortase/archaeosortase family protein [Tepidisphaeraceae bacterium]
GGGLLLAASLGYFACPFILPVTLIPFGEVACMSLAALAGLVLLLDWGIATLLFGLGVFTWGIWPGQNDWVKDFGMVLTLFGVVLTLCGWQVMRIAWFPILFLICALPWPGLFYSKIAMPLQQLAASVAVWTLQLTGVDASRVGTKIVMDYGFGRAPRILNVAEACAGMRSLMTFISVGAAVAFLSSRPLWQKLVITASAVPIAIFCNVMRVTGQGLLDYYVSPKLSESFAHQFVGLVMLVPAFFLILLVGWVLDQLFVEEVEDVDPLTVKVTPRRDSHPNACAAGGEDR